MTAQPRYLTIREVYEDLGIGRNKVYEMVASGEIPSVRFGERIVRIPRDEYEAWHRSLVARG